MENTNMQLSKTHKPQYHLITVYKFVDIPSEELKKISQEHLDFCRDIWLKWRIYIATEWISSTVTWWYWQCESYRLYLENSKYFKNIEWFWEKSTPVDGHKFPRMSVKVKDEIVKFWIKTNNRDVEKYKKKLSPKEVKRIIDEKDENYIILDMRNDYEYRLWHLKWAIPAWTVNFREVPKLLKKYWEKANWKKILWYCTWWIRCEKASVLANKIWDTEYYAIDGWVMWYVNSYNDWNWLWNLYTFDDRISTFIWDKNTHTTIWECVYSKKLTDNCENCRYSPCNAKLIADKKEFKSYAWFCSLECFEKAKKDLLIKDISWDSLNYQKIRNDSKSNPKNKEKNLELVKNHLDKTLWKKEFNHLNSQKETEIIEY